MKRARLLARYRRYRRSGSCSARPAGGADAGSADRNRARSSPKTKRGRSARARLAAFAGAMERAAARARPLSRRSFRIARGTGARPCGAALCGGAADRSARADRPRQLSVSQRRRHHRAGHRPVAARAGRSKICRSRRGAAEAARGEKRALLVAIPPNGSTINRARLPAWAADAPAVSEYDLMMQALAARNVAAVDLRPPLLAANASHRPIGAPTPTGTSSARWSPITRWWRRCASPAGPSIPTACCAVSSRVPGGDLARLLAVSATSPTRTP